MEIELLNYPNDRDIRVAVMAMRIPFESFDKSDTLFNLDLEKITKKVREKQTELGGNDLELMQKLIKAGSEHRKCLRFLDYTFSINAPLYWWKQFDTYKMGVEKSSSSTMHLLMKRKLSINDFAINTSGLQAIIDILNRMIEEYKIARENKDNELAKKIEADVYNLLPQGYLQTRIVKCSVEALINIYKQRKNHKLEEWLIFCKFVKLLKFFEKITEGIL